MDYSKYQEAIFQWVKNAIGKPKAALMVRALAGSGKTSTSVAFLDFIPKTQRVIYLAFNRHIVQATQSKVPANVDVKTINSYGWQVCRATYSGCQLNAEKVTDIAFRILPKKSYLGPIKRLISLKKANRHLTAEEILKLYDLDAPITADFLDYARTIWNQSTRNRYICDFDDQWFYPVLDELPLPQYDWVIVDEAQDLSSTQVELVARIAPRFVAIGDPNQSIYGFRGADPEAMDRLKLQVGAEELPLSICYRCPKAVIAEARKIVPDIEAAPNAVEGTVTQASLKNFRESVLPGDWVLCRTTAPLVSECLNFIRRNIKATVKGRDIGQQVLALVDRVSSKNQSLPIVEFQVLLREYYNNEAMRLESAGRDTQLEALTDRVDTISVLSEGLVVVGEIHQRVNSIFQDDACKGITFATAHRSKGLEAANIYILRPDLMPFPKAKSHRQEMNLKYVAITRAMSKLTWVTSHQNTS